MHLQTRTKVLKKKGGGEGGMEACTYVVNLESNLDVQSCEIRIHVGRHSVFEDTSEDHERSRFLPESTECLDTKRGKERKKERKKEGNHEFRCIKERHARRTICRVTSATSDVFTFWWTLASVSMVSVRNVCRLRWIASGRSLNSSARRVILATSPSRGTRSVDSMIYNTTQHQKQVSICPPSVTYVRHDPWGRDEMN